MQQPTGDVAGAFSLPDPMANTRHLG